VTDLRSPLKVGPDPLEEVRVGAFGSRRRVEVDQRRPNLNVDKRINHGEIKNVTKLE
jgi:hypothetical protein